MGNPKGDCKNECGFMIEKLLHWFYCLDLGEAALVVLAGTATFCLIDRKLEHLRRWRCSVCGVLLVLLAAMLYATLGNRSGGEDIAHVFTPFQSYREAGITGNVEIYRSNFMNVVLFYPAGLLAASLLPRRWPGWCRCILVVLVLAAMSAGIEFLQYRFCLGRCEIDDLIHNTAGALLGSLAALLPSIFTFLKEKAMSK